VATTAAGATVAPGDLSYTDMTGSKGTLSKPAQRLVCMWTDCFEMLKELGLEPIAVDNSVYKILLASADSYPIVDKNKTYRQVGGTFTQPDIEDLLSLQPDLIIGLAPQNNSIREALPNIPLFLVISPTYKQMVENLKTIGRLTGKTAEAAKAAEKFESKLAAYKAKSPDNKQVMLINTQDGVNFRVYTDQYLNCNLLNEVSKCTWTTGPEFKETSPGILNYTFEQILAANPEVLLSYVYPGMPGAPQLLKDSPLWKELKAVKNNQVFEINAAIAQPGGTLGLGILLDTVMTKLYPEVFPTPLN
jgi:iron complex transport system substrate-binding protein